MASLVYRYLSFVANDVIFFSNDVQTTTIAVAIASSLCCSIVLAVFHIIRVVRPSRGTLKGEKSVNFSIYDEKHCIRRQGSNKQSTSSLDDRYILCTENVDVPCVRCGKNYADPSCRFVTCKPCCFSLTACSFHHLNEDIKCRPCKDDACQQIQQIDLSECQIKHCPDRLGFVGAQLTLLNLAQNRLTDLPSEIGCLRGLRDFYLDHNSLTVLPDTLGLLENLEALNLSFNQIQSLPDSLSRLQKLKVLKAGHNKIETLPQCVTKMHGLISLHLEHNSLMCMDVGLTALTSLVILVLHNNPLSSLPDDIKNMINLQELDVSSCQLQYIPHGLCCVPKLRILDLSHNNLNNVPVVLGMLHSLQTLHINNNQLKYLPSTLNFDRFDSISVSDNPFHLKDDDIYTPVPLFPSLLEKTLRFVCNHGNYKTDILPSSLQETLQRKNICTSCGQIYFTFYKSSVRLKETLAGTIPFYSQNCSPHQALH